MGRALSAARTFWKEIIVTVIGGGVTAYFTLAKGSIDKQVVAIDEKIEKVESRTIRYIDTKHESVVKILKSMDDRQKVMDKRIYDIHRELRRGDN